MRLCAAFEARPAFLSTCALTCARTRVARLSRVRPLGAVRGPAHHRQDRFVKSRADLDLNMQKVYAIECLANGKMYVGKTKRSMHDRWRSHCAAGSGCWALKGAISKYGKQAFKCEVWFDGLSDAEAEEKERWLVHELSSLAPHGYNLTEGGQGSAHKNPHHGRNISRAWERPETRQKHMAWRTHEKLSKQANSDSQWRRQQMAWMSKRLEAVASLPPLEASRIIWHKSTKCREHARRQGRTEEQICWMDSVRDAQIAQVWEAANVPAPPASSYAQTAHSYEKQRWGKDNVAKALTRSRPSCACASGAEACPQQPSGTDSRPGALELLGILADGGDQRVICARGGQMHRLCASDDESDVG